VELWAAHQGRNQVIQDIELTIIKRILFASDQIMVDRAIAEWDKHAMSKYLQQLDLRSQTAAKKAGVAVTRVPLNANKVVLLVLVLVIIPTISGVALIA